MSSCAASNGIYARVKKGHPAGAKQQTERDQNNRFYSMYPDKTSDYIIENIRVGYFHDIQFYPGFIFSDEKKIAVQNLFQWDDLTEAYLNSRMRNNPL